MFDPVIAHQRGQNVNLFFVKNQISQWQNLICRKRLPNFAKKSSLASCRITQEISSILSSPQVVIQGHLYAQKWSFYAFFDMFSQTVRYRPAAMGDYHLIYTLPYAVDAREYSGAKTDHIAVTSVGGAWCRRPKNQPF